MELIKSPISTEAILETGLKTLFDKAGVEGCLVFYIPKGKGDVKLFDMGLCGHQLIAIAKTIKDEGEERLEDEEDHDAK